MDLTKRGAAKAKISETQALRLLHVEASGAEVAIAHELVDHIAHHDQVTHVKDGNNVLKRVGMFKGYILPIIDIRDDRSDTADNKVGENTFHDFLVLRMHGELVGVRVDRVIEILTVAVSSVESVGFRSDRSSEFITGMLSLPNKRLPIVDMNKLLYPAGMHA